MKEYTCTLCGWVYKEKDGYPEGDIVAGTKWEDMPENFVCPMCGADKEAFEETASEETEEGETLKTEETKASETEEIKAAGAGKETEETEELEEEDENMKEYTCTICGWVYNEEEGYPEGGIAPGTKWEEVAEDFVCPVCGAGKEAFE